MDNLRFLPVSEDLRNAITRGDYGVVLRLVRQRRGLTQAQAGQLAGYSAATISRFETGARRLADIPTLRHLATVLNVTPEIFGLTPGIQETSRDLSRVIRVVGTSPATVVTGASLGGDEVRRREVLAGMTGLSLVALLRAPRASAAAGPYSAVARLRAVAGNEAAALTALREAIRLALEVEGPAGGHSARERVADAVRYYDLNFSRFPPAVLAVEVQRTRFLVGDMLSQHQSDGARRELRRSMGWLSALFGNLAFVLADHTAALVYFSTAARLGTMAGDDDLVCWSLGAQAMAANADGRHIEALEVACNAYDYAHTPLRRAQVLAWGQLRSLAALGNQHRAEASRMMAMAQQEMAADPQGERAGRFGFDLAELHLHLAEATLAFDRHTQARRHALASVAHTSTGRPGWAAATLVLARGEAARRNHSDAVALAHEVLDKISPAALRETSRVRLRDLDADLFAHGVPSIAARRLRDRLHALPPLLPDGSVASS